MPLGNETAAAWASADFWLPAPPAGCGAEPPADPPSFVHPSPVAIVALPLGEFWGTSFRAENRRELTVPSGTDVVGRFVEEKGGWDSRQEPLEVLLAFAV